MPASTSRRCVRGRHLGLVALLATRALAGSALGAQELPPLVVEGRGGVALPLGSFRAGPDRGGEIARAPTFGLHFVYRGPSGWGPYIGFSQNRFDCADDGCPGEYVSTSWDLGMQRTLGGYGWVRAGLVFGRVERDFAAPGGPVRATSLLGLGADAWAGVRIPIKGRLALTPGVHAGWLNTQFRDAGLLGLRWLAADLGLALGF